VKEGSHRKANITSFLSSRANETKKDDLKIEDRLLGKGKGRG
jgi:hypothetical protein